jgi:hypothetical protein
MVRKVIDKDVRVEKDGGLRWQIGENRPNTCALTPMRVFAN